MPISGSIESNICPLNLHETVSILQNDENVQTGYQLDTLHPKEPWM